MSNIKIDFFGTSSGVPESGRNYSCSMLEVEGNHYFIDMGMIIEQKLVERKIDCKTIKGVFITHMHPDHTSGLPSFLYLADCYFKDCSPKVLLPQKNAVGGLLNWINCNRIDNNEFEDLKADINVYNSGEIYNDGTVAVTAIPNKHIPDSYSFLIKAKDKNIIFTGDISNPQRDFPSIMSDKKIDLLVCETAHFSPKEYIPIFEKYDIKKIYFNHYSQSKVNEINSLKTVYNNIEILVDDFAVEI